jgi:hypothetical protein
MLTLCWRTTLIARSLLLLGGEITIADDRAELVFGDGVRDLTLHAAVERGPELIFLKGGG